MKAILNVSYELGEDEIEMLKNTFDVKTDEELKIALKASIKSNVALAMLGLDAENRGKIDMNVSIE